MLKCLHCGGALAPGKLSSHFDKRYDVRFKPDRPTPFFSFGPPRLEVEALMCESCGRIELHGNTNKLREVLNR